MTKLFSPLFRAVKSARSTDCVALHSDREHFTISSRLRRQRLCSYFSFSRLLATPRSLQIGDPCQPLWLLFFLSHATHTRAHTSRGARYKFAALRPRRSGRAKIRELPSRAPEKPISKLEKRSRIARSVSPLYNIRTFYRQRKYRIFD